jgi:hypothetical protein
VDSIWNKVKNTYLGTSESVRGLKNYFKKNWMSEYTWQLINQRKQIKAQKNISKTREQRALAEAAYTAVDRQVKKSVRNDKRKWIDKQALRAEQAAVRGDEKELYTITKMLSKRVSIETVLFEIKRVNY